jgi:hypothetical protein
MLLLRATRWPPVALMLAASATVLLLAKHPAELVGALAVALPFASVWFVDDPASNLTAGARWGRRPQLVARCAAAGVVTAGAWFAAVAWAGGAPSYAGVVLLALLAVALAAGVTWGATYGGPCAAVVWVVTQIPEPPWRVSGARWWVVAAAGACWLWVAARDPARG